MTEDIMYKSKEMDMTPDRILLDGEWDLAYVPSGDEKPVQHLPSSEWFACKATVPGYIKDNMSDFLKVARYWPIATFKLNPLHRPVS